METLRGLGINTAKAKALTITFDGVLVENYVFDGKRKVIRHTPGGKPYPLTEFEHIRFVD